MATLQRISAEKVMDLLAEEEKKIFISNFAKKIWTIPQSPFEIWVYAETKKDAYIKLSKDESLRKYYFLSGDKCDCACSGQCLICNKDTRDSQKCVHSINEMTDEHYYLLTRKNVDICHIELS